MHVPRFFFQATVGVPNFVVGTQSRLNQRSFVHRTIDNADFQHWVVFVAAIGFLTDAYDIFALNSVIPLLGFVYWNRAAPPRGIVIALQCATLGGTLIGQVLFGVLADLFGRRKMYGLELLTVILATLAMTMAATGAECSMDIVGWLIFWRVCMGIGIGGDYPLSAVITSEFAPTQWRSRMLAMVFFMQPLGQLLGSLFSLIVIQGFSGHIQMAKAGRQLEEPRYNICYAPHDPILNGEGIRAVDRAWRLIIGLGAVPALLAIVFRFTIPESPRYLLDVAGQFKDAAEATEEYWATGQDSTPLIESSTDLQNDSAHMNGNGIAHPPQAPQARTPSTWIQMGQLQRSDTPSQGRDLTDGESNADSHVDSELDARQNGTGQAPSYEQFLSVDAYTYFITERNWTLLAGTSLAWMFLDLPFYGLGLSSGSISRVIWYSNQDDGGLNSLLPGLGPSGIPVFRYLLDGPEHLLILQSIGAVLGSALTVKLVGPHVRTWSLQFYGFVCLTALLLVTGGLMKANTGTAPIVLYVLLQACFNLGPNPTTYMIPAELFPTRFRATCHGISAAFGRIGAIGAQVFVGYVEWVRWNLDQQRDRDQVNSEAYTWHLVFTNGKVPKQGDVGNVLMVMSVFSAAGALVTFLWIPRNMQSRNRESRTLEVLAVGKRGGRQLSVEDEVG